MNIAVCIKEIIDPEIPARAFRIDPEARRAIRPPGIELVISDYDEFAVEAALQIKDKLESQITIVSLGGESARASLRRCIAMGADEGVLISDPLFDDADSFATASILAGAIKRLGEFDLILCGRQEGDWDAGQVGSGIAELLSLPSVTTVGGIKIEGAEIVAERIVDGGRETVAVPLPALLTVSSEIGEPRYPSIRRVREAAKKEIPTLDAQAVSPVAAQSRMLSLRVPVRDTQCEYITGATPEEIAANLALKLRSDGLI